MFYTKTGQYVEFLLGQVSRRAGEARAIVNFKFRTKVGAGRRGEPGATVNFKFTTIRVGTGAGEEGG